MKILYKYILILALPTLLFASCTKQMEDMNNDPKSLTNERLMADGVLYKQHISFMEKNLFNLTSTWEYQVQQDLNADVFAGYVMHPGSFGITTTNDNYNFNFNWNGYAFSVAQANLTEFLQLKSQTNSGADHGDFYAYGLILKVWTAIPLVDGFGPFPYLQYGIGTNPVFNNLDSIYKVGFLPELTSAIDTLEHYKAGTAANRVKNSGSDITSLGGDITNWIKLANTLKLRLAIRISNVDPTAAATYIQDVVSDPNGFIDSSTGDVSINCSNSTLGVSNPFASVSTAWVDCVMSADMQSFLDGFKDPREGVYFLPASDPNVATQGGEFAGIRPGSALLQGKGEKANFSLLNVPNNFMLLSGAESYFLLAEAALKNMGGKTPAQAQALYEAGVNASFTLHGLTTAQATSYLSSTSKPADYIDYSDASNNYTATTSITPKWDGVNSLEQILTQKWIANFPQGAESWAEVRRTGFPKLTLPKNIVNNSNADGTVPAGSFIKRMPYPSNIISLSTEQANAAIAKYLDGKDGAMQILWWMGTAPVK